MRLTKALAGGRDRLVSTIAVVLLLEVGCALAFCQLAFFPITLPGMGIRFHSFLFFAPFAAAALYLSLPVYLGCAALLGGLLCLRIQFLPMDFFELLFSNPMGSIMTTCLFALVIWLVLNGTRRLLKDRACTMMGNLAFAAALFATSLTLMVIWIAYLNAIFAAYGYGDMLSTLTGPMWFDWLVWLVAAMLSSALIRKFASEETEPTLRTVFRRWLFLVVVGAFLLTTSVSFLFSSVQALGEADDSLSSQVNYVGSVVQQRLEDQQAVEGLVDSYEDGFIDSIAIGKGQQTVSTSNESYAQAFADAEFVRLLHEGKLQFLQDMETLGIVYFKGASVAGYDIAAFAKSDRIFANRTSVLAMNTMCYLVLFAAVFVLVSKLLDRVVVRGFKRTNKVLSLITDGDLEQRVEERETQEFRALSDGINTTVCALEDLIDEAERRMERDLATAKAIQESALPRTFPAFPEIGEFEIYASMDAAKEVGGDFFDFFLIDERTLGFLIADVSGKGIPGALFMMAAKAEIENRMLEGIDLAQAISGANQYLCANNDAGMFVTVWAATLDWVDGRVTYVNAGHNFPLLYHADDGTWEWLKKKCGLFLGTFEVAKYRTETLALEPGDKLVLYTDGVNEAFSASEEEYGNPRLEKFLAGHGDLRPKELVEALRADVATWAEGAEQSDDVTILVLEYTGAS